MISGKIRRQGPDPKWTGPRKGVGTVCIDIKLRNIAFMGYNMKKSSASLLNAGNLQSADVPKSEDFNKLQYCFHWLQGEETSSAIRTQGIHN